MRSNKALAWAAVAVGLAARFAWVWLGPHAVVTDAAAYRELAHSLARGAGYATAAGPSALWLPGWPAWMALFYAAHTGDVAVAIGNVVLGGATIAATYAFARRACGAGAARVAAVIVALWPSLIVLPGLLLSENLALPCVMADAMLLVWAMSPRGSPLRWLVCGLACGATIYVRESCVVLALACVALTALRRIVRRSGTRPALTAWLAYLVAIAFVLAPWMARNRDVIGTRRLTTRGAVNLCIGFGEGATGGYRQLPVPNVAVHTHADAELARAEAARTCVQQGLARHPLSVVTLAPAKLSRLLVWDDWTIDDFFAPQMHPRTAAQLRVACNGIYWGILAFAGIGFFAGRRRAVRGRRWSNARLVATVVPALFVASALATFGSGRFHVMMQPFLAVFAGRGAVLAMRRVGFWYRERS